MGPEGRITPGQVQWEGRASQEGSPSEDEDGRGAEGHALSGTSTTRIWC